MSILTKSTLAVLALTLSVSASQARTFPLNGTHGRAEIAEALAART